jgi:hypothetical protein
MFKYPVIKITFQEGSVSEIRVELLQNASYYSVENSYLIQCPAA